MKKHLLSITCLIGISASFDKAQSSSLPNVSRHIYNAFWGKPPSDTDKKRSNDTDKNDLDSWLKNPSVEPQAEPENEENESRRAPVQREQNDRTGGDTDPSTSGNDRSNVDPTIFARLAQEEQRKIGTSPSLDDSEGGKGKDKLYPVGSDEEYDPDRMPHSKDSALGTVTIGPEDDGAGVGSSSPGTPFRVSNDEGEKDSDDEGDENFGKNDSEFPFGTVSTDRSSSSSSSTNAGAGEDDIDDSPKKRRWYNRLTNFWKSRDQEQKTEEQETSAGSDQGENTDANNFVLSKERNTNQRGLREVLRGALDSIGIRHKDKTYQPGEEEMDETSPVHQKLLQAINEGPRENGRYLRNMCATNIHAYRWVFFKLAKDTNSGLTPEDYYYLTTNCPKILDSKAKVVEKITYLSDNTMVKDIQNTIEGVIQYYTASLEKNLFPELKTQDNPNFNKDVLNYARNLKRLVQDGITLSNQILKKINKIPHKKGALISPNDFNKLSFDRQWDILNDMSKLSASNRVIIEKYDMLHHKLDLGENIKREIRELFIKGGWIRNRGNFYDQYETLKLRNNKLVDKMDWIAVLYEHRTWYKYPENQQRW